MVGGFSATPYSAQPHARVEVIRLSILRTVTMMLLMLTALTCPVPSAASQAVSQADTNIRSGHKIQKSGSDGPKSGLLKLHHVHAATPTTQLHRRFLADVGDQLSRLMDQATRALVGSSPPKCIKKCGACTPCKSVLVPIHTTDLPATPAEYYPEAWRCQCKGKIYNP